MSQNLVFTLINSNYPIRNENVSMFVERSGPVPQTVGGFWGTCSLLCAILADHHPNMKERSLTPPLL